VFIINIFKYFVLGIINLPLIFFSIIKHFLIGLIVVITIIPKYFIIGIIYIFNKNKRKEITYQNKPLIPIVMVSLSLFVYFLSVFLFSRWYVQGLKIQYLTNDIISSTEIIEEEETNLNIEDTNENNGQNTTNSNNDSNNNVYYPNDYWDYISVPYMNVDFSSLLEKNSDTVGWIKVEGTKVNYPIVQTTDNEYYLNHDFQKNANSGGWIFGDYRNNLSNPRKNTIIYGHNMKNKTMFGSIPDSVLSKSWQNNPDNHVIKMSTLTSNTIWKIFSVYTIEPETYYLKTVFPSTKYQEFIDTIKSRSIYNFNTEITTQDKIITLSTCDNAGTKRVVVHAKLIKTELK